MPRSSKYNKNSGSLVFFSFLVLGLALRLVFLYTTQYMGLMIADEHDYHRLALNVLHHHVFGWHSDTPTSLRPPLYPAFAALIWSITGSESLLYIRLVQIGISLLNVYFVYRLGLLLFERHVARYAAIGFWLYPSLIAFNFLFLTETLFTCLLTLVALGYVVLLKTGKRSVAWWTGIALGCAALTRSILWPFPLLLCPFAWLTLSGNWRLRAQLIIALVLGYVVIVAPWAVRNTRLQEVFTVVDTMGGLNLMMGNYEHTPLNRAWDAVSLRGEKSWVYHLPKTPPNGLRWTEGHKEKWAQRQGIAYMLAHPALTLKRAAVKFANFWGLERVIIAGWQQGLYHPPRWFAVMGAIVITSAYTLTMLCASLGYCLVRRDDWRAHAFLLLVTIFICGIHTVIFGHERYHVPLIPFVLLYAAAALRHQSWRRLREGVRTAAPPLLLCLGLLLIWGRELFVIEADRIRALLRLFSG
ncbi:MAG: ArnT family glycosyltransferase [Candidatus Tectimicrobiota bacterium]